MGRQFAVPAVAKLAAAMCLCLVATACGQAAGASGEGKLGPITGAPLGPSVAIVPAADATDIPPDTPVTVSTQDGTLETVTLTNSEGKKVSGEIAADAHSWRSTEPLGYGKMYRVAVTAVDTSGNRKQVTSQFGTVKPANLTLPYLRPSGSGTFGVGEPIVIRFDEPIPDRAVAEKTIHITTSPEVAGRFHWFNSQEVHWRPAKYWTPGTRVSVKVDAYGVHFGNGLWGQDDRAVSFTIGPSKIAIADNTTHYMKVYINGSMVRNIPVSMGKGGTTTGSDGRTIDFWTRSGPHVVMDKEPVVRMRSASFGITDPKDPNFYDEDIKLAVRISATGEYVHLADWNIPAQGVTNTSHGCINVGPANAQWFYNTFGPGDVVDVLHTPKQLEAWNGIGDWTIPWSQW